MTNTNSPAPDLAEDPTRGSRGSALLAAILVVVLLTAMGLILMFVSQTDVTISSADLRSKQAFYLAEAATEHGREQLRLNMIAADSGDLSLRLDVAAGQNNTLDIDPASIRPLFSNGAVSGFSGTGDDVPVIAPTALGEGWYAAFVTNDPADGETNTTDTNDSVMLTGIGVARDGSIEVAQSIMIEGLLFPSIPATVTLLGPQPDFKHSGGKGWSSTSCPKIGLGASKYYVDGDLYKKSKLRKAYNGTDCPPYRELDGIISIFSKVKVSKLKKVTASKLKLSKFKPAKPPKTKDYDILAPTGGTGGIPGLFVPTYGALGPNGVKEVEDEMKSSKIDYLSDINVRTQVLPPDFLAGNYIDGDTIADLTDPTEPTVIGSGLGSLHSAWQTCSTVKTIVEKLRADADYLCTPPGCSLPATTPSSIVFIDGDFVVPCGTENYGMLVVTGALDFPGTSSWHGIVLVLGEGQFYRIKEEGFGNITGGTVIANIAGPDNVYGTNDDCTGGTGGFASVKVREYDKARGTTAYCSAEIAAADPGWKEPTRKQAFRQR